MPGNHPATGKWILALLLLAGANGPARAQMEPLVKQRVVAAANGHHYLLTSRLKALLIGTFTYGFEHVQAKTNLDSTLSRIGRAEGWTVDRITRDTDVTAAKLANYQVFFGNYISGWTNPSFPIEGRTALQDFVETKGNGLFLQHSSGDATNDSWTWFRTYAHPCHYTGNAHRNAASTGKVGVFKGYLDNPGAESHPILEGIHWDGKDSTTWSNNELHTFHKPILDSSITPVQWQGLLSLNAATCGTPNTCGQNDFYDYSSQGGNYPLSWTFPLKKGSIGYFMEGHDLSTLNSMTQPIWDRFFRQFMYFIAGYDSMEVSTAIPPSVSGRGAAGSPYAPHPSGITFRDGAEPGVLITKGGSHVVALYDLSGKLIREERGQDSPVEYVFSRELSGKRGVYLMSARVSGAARSRKILLR
jgi:hypothetical protein